MGLHQVSVAVPFQQETFEIRCSLISQESNI